MTLNWTATRRNNLTRRKKKKKEKTNKQTQKPSVNTGETQFALNIFFSCFLEIVFMTFVFFKFGFFFQKLNIAFEILLMKLDGLKLRRTYDYFICVLIFFYYLCHSFSSFKCLSSWCFELTFIESVINLDLIGWLYICKLLFEKNVVWHFFKRSQLIMTQGQNILELYC